MDEEPAVVLPPDLFDRYRRFSLYNSPYAAHDEGRAVDLYPAPGTAPSPVGGTVLATRSVSAPPKPYAEAEDHLILIAVEDGIAPQRRDSLPPADGEGALVARVLHVDPAVEPGDRVRPGEDLGRTVRSGFFAPWVGDHLHVGVRRRRENLYRASGSLPLRPDVAVEGLDWDGRGTVVERGETYVVLDRPVHPAPGESWAGIAPDGDGGGVLDGGFPHYDGGGVLGRAAPVDGAGPPSAVRLLGTEVGTANGRTVAWADRTVTADGAAITGLSLFVGRDRDGAKLVCPDHDFAEGEAVEVRVE